MALAETAHHATHGNRRQPTSSTSTALHGARGQTTADTVFFAMDLDECSGARPGQLLEPVQQREHVVAPELGDEHWDSAMPDISGADLGTAVVLLSSTAHRETRFLVLAMMMNLLTGKAEDELLARHRGHRHVRFSVRVTLAIWMHIQPSWKSRAPLTCDWRLESGNGLDLMAWLGSAWPVFGVACFGVA